MYTRIFDPVENLVEKAKLDDDDSKNLHQSEALSEQAPVHEESTSRIYHAKGKPNTRLM